MSRLADALMRPERRSARVEEGQLPILVGPQRRASSWLQLVLVGTLVAILAALVAVMSRQKNVAPNATVLKAPVMINAVPTAEERFASFKSQGIEKVEQGELQEAARLFRAALELKPNDPETWNSLGVVLVSQRHLREGISAFDRALRASPDHSAAHRNLAVALDREGRVNAAIAHYQAFLRLARDNDPARSEIRRRLVEISADESEK
jgi:cytochrome c-type biogenesis protein CcmH/NrfG